MFGYCSASPSLKASAKGSPKCADCISGQTRLTTIVPATGPAAGLITITITGTGFVTGSFKVQVCEPARLCRHFRSSPYTSYWASQVGTGQSDGVFVSSTRITATLPPGTGAALPVSVIYGTNETNKLTFSYGPFMHALHACPGFYCGSSSGSWSLL